MRCISANEQPAYECLLFPSSQLNFRLLPISSLKNEQCLGIRMTSEAEILVHIIAPSTSKDDTLYRTFATAYLNFEPGETVALPEDTRSTYPAPPSAVLDSPQASFQSVWDNVRPRAAQPHSQRSGRNSSQHGKESQGSWVQPPSEVADSMPDNDIRIEGFTTPTRIMQYFLQTAGPPSSDLSASPEAGRRDATSIYAGNNDLTTLLGRSTGSILKGNSHNSTDQVTGEASALRPTNYEGSTDITNLLARGTNTIIHHDYTPTALIGEKQASFQHNDDVSYETPEIDKPTSESRMDISHVSQTPSSPLQSRRAPRPFPTTSSGDSKTRSPGLVRTHQQSQTELSGITIPATQLPERADSEPPSAKRLKRTHLQGNSPGLNRSISDILPRGSRQSSTPQQPRAKDLPASATQQTIDWSHETQLTSVEPPPANHKLGSRVPVKLELLMRNFGTEGRYKPKFQARKLREYERGYWLLGLNAWDHRGKVETWGFLGNYIRKDGFAGWGTRACRDEDWKWIRLYGWEHIAGELYILLYVASYRRLKAMELTWYDGAGKELIIVGARSDKSILEWR